MDWHADELDDETLARAERECLERPSNSAMWDDRLYVTHGPVLSWAERGDDIREESNYLSVLEHLQGVAEDEEDVIDATIGDWLVGSLRQIFVKVRGDRCQDCGAINVSDPANRPGCAGNGEDCIPEYTRAFREAVAVALSLQDYPVFSDDDLIEREWAAYERDLDDAIASAQRDYEDDDTEQAVIADILHDMDLGETFVSGGSADWELVAELYRQARDRYFTEKAEEVYRSRFEQIPGQLSLT